MFGSKSLGNCCVISEKLEKVNERIVDLKRQVSSQLSISKSVLSQCLNNLCSFASCLKLAQAESEAATLNTEISIHQASITKARCAMLQKKKSSGMALSRSIGFPRDMLKDIVEESQRAPELTIDEVSQLLCSNPYLCDSSKQPPQSIIEIFGPHTVISPEVPPERTIALLSCCTGCNKLAVRSIMTMHKCVKVVFDNNKLMETPGVSLDEDGQSRSMFVDAMAYGHQALGVKCMDDFLITSALF